MKVKRNRESRATKARTCSGICPGRSPYSSATNKKPDIPGDPGCPEHVKNKPYRLDFEFGFGLRSAGRMEYVSTP